MGRFNFTPKTAPSLSTITTTSNTSIPRPTPLTTQTASGSNQPFCHNTLCRQTDMTNSTYYWPYRNVSYMYIARAAYCYGFVTSSLGLSVVADEMMYAADIANARILAVNLTTSSVSVLYQALDDTQPYTVAAGSQYIYFSAWNRKLVGSFCRLLQRCVLYCILSRVQICHYILSASSNCLVRRCSIRLLKRLTCVSGVNS